MNDHLPASTVAAATKESAKESARQPLDVRGLAAALAGIAADSQRETESYLRDTVVPHGGE